MGKLSLKLWVLGLMVWVGLGATGPDQCAAQRPFPTAQGWQVAAIGRKPSITESISSAFKQGMGRFAEMVKPKTPVKPADDPVSLASKGKPGAELYVAVARLYEESGNLTRAAEHYQKALKHTPNHLAALLGYARLKNRLGEPDEAKKFYLQATKAHPNDPSVYNNLALFYARHRMLNESVAALGRAIQLQPKNARYRNNIAAVLVQMGQRREAFTHLRAAHSEAVAYYNLGYLLEKKRQLPAAAQHFAEALRLDPSLVPARLGLERLQGPPVQARKPAGRPDAGTRVSSRPRRPTGQAGGHVPSPGGQRPVVRQLPPPPMHSRYDTGRGQAGARGPQANGSRPSPPYSSIPSRLPATSGGQAVPPMPAPQPFGSYRRQPTPTAPLPPRATQGPAVEHLPRVN